MPLGLNKLVQSRLVWILLLILCILMILVALYYQYILDYPPCALCIHIRILVVVMAIISIFGIIFCKSKIFSFILYLLSFATIIFFLERTWQLYAVENILIISSCSMESALPNWLPLDKWLPSVFEVRDFCGYTPLMLFDFSMADYLMLISITLSIIWLILLLTSYWVNFKKSKA